MRKVKPSKLTWKDTGHGYFRKIFMQVNNELGKDCKVQFVRIPPNTMVRPHSHKGQTESEYVISGSGIAKSRKQSIRYIREQSLL